MISPCSSDTIQNYFKGNKALEIINKNTVNLRIFHQNIWGLTKKMEELITHLSNRVPHVLCFRQHLPHVLCFRQHHLKEFEINNTCINHYNLGAYYCRITRKLGGVGIFVHDTLSYTSIDLNEYCNEQDLEACALKLKISNNVFCILCIYRPPTGNFATFIHLFQSLLNRLYTNSLHVIICGDININYVQVSNYKFTLNSLLATYNLYSTVHFPTSHQSSSTATDNIFINKVKNSNYSNNNKLIRPSNTTM